MMRKTLGQLYWIMQQEKRLRSYRYGLLPTLRFLSAVAGQRFDLQQHCDFHMEHLCFSLRPRDWFTLQEIILDDEYQHLNLIQRHDANIRVILDLGANIGLFSLACLRIWPNASVHAVEPVPDTFDQLERNRTKNPSSDWNTHRLAVCDRKGSIPFETHQLSTGNRMTASEAADTLLPATTLGDLLKEIGNPVIDLAKIDIEGAEEAALCCSPQSLQAIRHLIIELHPDACNTDRVIEVLYERFDHIYSVGGRSSAKPLILASNDAFPLPAWETMAPSPAKPSNQACHTGSNPGDLV